MKQERTAYILNKGSRTEFPKGSHCAVGEAKFHHHADGQNESLRAGSMGLALHRAVTEFKATFGREPQFDEVMFRGTFTTSSCIVEICELPE